MALHDVGKTPDRSSPSPNIHDVLEGLQAAHGTSSVFYTASNPAKILSTVIPAGQGGGTGNITNAPSSFTGRLAPPSQPVAYGQAQVGVSSSSISWTTITHNLGYTPAVQAFVENAKIQLGDGTIITNSGSIPLPAFGGVDVNAKVAGGVVFTTYYQAIPDSTNLYLVCYNATGVAAGLNITYYLYQQQAS